MPLQTTIIELIMGQALQTIVTNYQPALAIHYENKYCQMINIRHRSQANIRPEEEEDLLPLVLPFLKDEQLIQFFEN